MPISITVEDGSEVAGANSYLSLAAADTYHEAVIESAVWDEATTDEKNRALVQATRVLGTQYRWKGCRTTSTQPLAWPRKTMVYDGVGIDDDVIPQVLKDAQAEIARELLVTDGFVVRPESAAGGDALKNLVLGKGALEIEFQNQQPILGFATAVTPYVEDMLRGLDYFLGGGGGRMVRATR